MKKIICLLVLVLVLGCGRIENQTLGDAEDEDTGGEDVALADVSPSDRLPWDSAVPTGNHAVIVAANWTDPIGSLANPRKVEKMLAPMMIRNIIAVVLPDSRRHSTSFFRVILPLRQVMRNAPKAPTPAAFVGVKMPL